MGRKHGMSVCVVTLLAVTFLARQSLYGQLTIEEDGGPFRTAAALGDVPSVAEGNLALQGVPFGSSTAGAGPSHAVAHINDGLYSNSQSWIGRNNGPDTGEQYVGVSFAAERTITQIALGRDNNGTHSDRNFGMHRIEYTTESRDFHRDAEVAAASWTLIGEVEPTVFRARYSFAAVTARAVRVVVTGAGVGWNVIDEMELYEEYGVGATPADLDPRRDDGVPTPGIPGDVPGLEAGNLAQSSGAMPFGTSGGNGGVPSLNDGMYGNSNGWLSNGTGPLGEIYAGVAFPDGPVDVVHQIALGRDSTGTHPDRSSGPYIVQYSTADIDYTDQDAVAAADWTFIGCGTHHIGHGRLQLRRLYGFDPVTVRAIRVMMTAPHTFGNAIDEIELYAGVTFVRGDVNSDGTVDIADAIYLFQFLFLGGPGLLCDDAGDADNTGVIELTTGIYLLDALFTGGPDIPPPDDCNDVFFGDSLGCASYPPCS